MYQIPTKSTSTHPLLQQNLALPPHLILDTTDTSNSTTSIDAVLRRLNKPDEEHDTLSQRVTQLTLAFSPHIVRSMAAEIVLRASTKGHKEWTKKNLGIEYPSSLQTKLNKTGTYN